MPQPQPGADRPADGGTPVTGRDRDPAVTDEPVPPSDGPPTAPDGSPTPPTDAPAADGVDPPAVGGEARDADDGSRDTGPDTPTVTGADAPSGDGDAAAGTGDDPATIAGATSPDAPGDAAEAAAPAPVIPARGSATVPTRTEPASPTARPDPTRVANQPDPTRVETRPEPAAPRWSGSAAVPPPPPRKRSWGESAEPTPVPPPPAPEHQVPVDPWAGADTSGWELRSADFPALPPTLPYPAQPHPLPYPAPPVAPPPGPPVAARPVSPPPAPVSPPPAAPARPPKQRRGSAPPPVAPPPDWRAPKGYVPVPVRRRRRWPWLLLLTLVCCCGVPFWWLQPMSTQYPASAALPDQVSGLRLRQDERSQATAERLKTEVRQAHLLAEDTFAGVYATDDGKRVTVLGGTGFRFSPESDAKAELARLQEGYALDPAVPVETHVRGRYERCAVGRADGDTVVVCTSVDHGSLVTAVFTRLSVQDSAALLDTLRQQIITPDRS
ncbi:hypothetical protein [Micromonospora coerulea]|uniref:hypothetical protein n=1 Tax=Micromonospora coerulea TaxID=47856 RepID=UPI001F234EE7|nr:hypothetical protein [Micromonospora veneta]